MLYRLGSADLGYYIVFRCVLSCVLNVTINLTCLKMSAIDQSPPFDYRLPFRVASY